MARVSRDAASEGDRDGARPRSGCREDDGDRLGGAPDRRLARVVEAGRADHDRRAGGDARVEVRKGSLGPREIDQHVAAGDTLLRLDPTQTRATLAIVNKSIDELTARRARGEAEQTGAETIAFPALLKDRSDDIDVLQLLANERSAANVLGRRLTASVALVKALGGGWSGGEPAR